MLDSTANSLRGSTSFDVYHVSPGGDLPQQMPSRDMRNEEGPIKAMRQRQRGITRDQLWIEQQKVDLTNHQPDNGDTSVTHSSEISADRVTPALQPRVHVSVPARNVSRPTNPTGSTFRRTYFFLEVTADGESLKMFHTKELLAYVASQGGNNSGRTTDGLKRNSKARSLLQLRDIRQVFGGITRYTIEPRGNCILINLCHIRCIVFKDRALFLLFAGGNLTPTGSAFDKAIHYHSGKPSTKYDQPIYGMPNWPSRTLSRTPNALHPPSLGQSIRKMLSDKVPSSEQSRPRSKESTAVLADASPFKGGSNQHHVDESRPSSTKSHSTSSSLTLDQLARQLDPTDRKELFDIHQISESLHLILANSESEKVHDATLDAEASESSTRVRGSSRDAETPILTIPVSECESDRFMSSNGDEKRQKLIDDLSKPPMERDMIEVLLLETCRIVWTNAWPIIECAKTFEKKPPEQLTHHLSEVQKLKRQVDGALDEIKGVRTALTELLDEHEDMEAMCLTVPVDDHLHVEDGINRKNSFTRLDSISSQDCYEYLLKQTQDDHLNEMELMLECYLQEIEAMASQLTRIDESTDDILHFLQLHLATIRNNFLRLEVVLNILGVLFGLVGAYAGLFGMNLHNGYEEAPWLFWNTVLCIAVLVVLVLWWMYRYLTGNTHNLPTDVLFKPESAQPLYTHPTGEVSDTESLSRPRHRLLAQSPVLPAVSSDLNQLEGGSLFEHHHVNTQQESLIQQLRASSRDDLKA